MNRHIKSLDTITTEELNALQCKKIAVVGCGGLGGYTIEMLARFGVGTIVVVDDDVFDITNLNRQLLSDEENIGKKKTDAAILRIKKVNSDVKIKSIDKRLDKDNAIEHLKNVDIVIDCVDNLETRFAMQDACEELGIPMIHGAVGTWQGQVATILPGDRTLGKIYGSENLETPKTGASPFIPATIASYQVVECIKVALDKGEILRNKIMYFDMLNNQSFVIDFNKSEEKK